MTRSGDNHEAEKARNPFSPAVGVELEENQRAMPRRAVLMWVGGAVIVFIFCLGLYFGLFAARIGG